MGPDGPQRRHAVGGPGHPRHGRRVRQDVPRQPDPAAEAGRRHPPAGDDGRRPAFVIGCGLLWGLSAAGHVGWSLYHKAHHPELLDPKLVLGEVSPLWVAIDLAVALVGGTVGIVLLWTLYTAVYNRLVAQEAKTTRLTEPLLANVAAYAFGPSLLAVIPIAGPPLAAVAMLLAMIAVGTSPGRLRLRPAAAVIDALLAFIAMAAVGVVGSAVLHFASDRFVPSGVPTEERTVNDANQPAIRSSSDSR